MATKKTTTKKAKAQESEEKYDPNAIKPMNIEKPESQQISELEKQIVKDYVKQTKERIEAVVKQCRTDLDNAIQPLKTFAAQNDLNIEKCEIKTENGLTVNIDFKISDLEARFKHQAIRNHLEKVRHANP